MSFEAFLKAEVEFEHRKNIGRQFHILGRHNTDCMRASDLQLHPIPVLLPQEFIDILLLLLTTLCNRSLHKCDLPPTQKRSILIPALMSNELDAADPVSYTDP